jgi:hypothetical protein
MFKLILTKIHYNFESKSVPELFDVIDNLVYNDKNKQVIKIIYQIFISNYNKNKFKFIFPSDISKIILQPEYKNVYEFEKIMFINSKYKDIIINIKKIE